MTEELKKQGIADGAADAETVEETAPRPTWTKPPRRRSARLVARHSMRKMSAPRTSAPAPRRSACATLTTRMRTRHPATPGRRCAACGAEAAGDHWRFYIVFASIVFYAIFNTAARHTAPA